MNSLRFTGITLIALIAGCFNPKYASPGFECSTDPTKGQDCPSGQTCQPVGSGYQCVGTSGGGTSSGDNLSIPTTGTYMAPTADAMLNSESDCPDASLEPDDDFGQAVPLPSNNITVDGSPLKLQNLAICPKGPNPKAKNHDVDLYQITVPQSLSAVVSITYDIQYGDLNLGIFDTNANLIASDGSSQSNACVASSLQPGTYFIGVFGAMNMDVNRYSMSVKYTSAAGSCP